MSAKQAEEMAGISRRNLRFYEQQGLIHPSRNPGNDYRDYSGSDIVCLKKIRALRMLDVSLEEIGAVLRSEVPLSRVMVRQEEKLRRKQQEVKTAIRFCQELQREEPDPDELLRRMDQPEVRPALCGGWVRDYQAIAAGEAKKRFTFPAGREIATPREFTAALEDYARREQLALVIPREGMNPEFTLDGVAYTAARECFYGSAASPSDVISCEAVHPEAFEPEVRGRRAVFSCSAATGGGVCPWACWKSSTISAPA